MEDNIFNEEVEFYGNLRQKHFWEDEEDECE